MPEGDSNIVDLPAIVDLDAVEELRDGLLDAIERGPVTVNGAAVERLCTNALFMLMSAAETARRHDSQFVISAVTEPVRQAISRLGLDGQFAGLLRG